jgi:hypothetical protein
MRTYSYHPVWIFYWKWTKPFRNWDLITRSVYAFEAALSCRTFFSYDVPACVVARVGAVDSLHFSPAKVPVTHRFRDPLYLQQQYDLHSWTNNKWIKNTTCESWVLYLVLNGGRATPGSRQFGLAVGETRVYEEPVVLGTGESFNRCHHLVPEIYKHTCAHKIG